MLYEREKQVVITAVTAAAKLCEQVRQEQGSNAISKPDSSPVTIADFGAQAIICQSLAEAFPNDSVIGEEDSTLLRSAVGGSASSSGAAPLTLSPDMSQLTAQICQYVKKQIPNATPESIKDWIDWGNGKVESRYWTLDPIDGTKGYVRGDQYAIALALVEAGKVKLGILGCPSLPVDYTKPNGERGVIFVAVQNQGTTMIPLNGGEPKQIHVNNADEINSHRLTESVETQHGDVVTQEAIAQAVGLTSPTLRIDSQAKYGIVARGEAALYIRLPFPEYWELRENTWDHAAGAIVVEEAGGRVTDLYGKPLDYSFGVKLINNQGIVASNGAIHEAVLTAIAERIKKQD